MNQHDWLGPVAALALWSLYRIERNTSGRPPAPAWTRNDYLGAAMGAPIVLLLMSIWAGFPLVALAFVWAAIAWPIGAVVALGPGFGKLLNKIPMPTPGTRTNLIVGWVALVVIFVIVPALSVLLF